WGRATWHGCFWQSPDNCQPDSLDAPTPVRSLLEIPGAIAIGDGCAARADGHVLCLDIETDRRRPDREIAGLRGAIAVAGPCALEKGGRVACWADTDRGQPRGRATGPVTALPVEGLPPARQITAGDAHVCALLTDGTARCWGANSNGQLGD